MSNLMNSDNSRFYHLKPNRELRIVTMEKPNHYDRREECITIRILSDVQSKKNENLFCTAEIFGRELVVDKEYSFGYNEKFAIYTYTGCVIQIKGKTLQEYESKNSSIKEYVSLAYILDAYRKLAKKKKTVGPRVLITGNTSSGKSTVSYLLCNYAVKSGFKPLFVEADPKCSCDKIEMSRGPGVLSTFIYDYMTTCNYSLDFYFGYLDINQDLTLYYHLNECMSSCIHLMLLNNLNTQTSTFGNEVDGSDDLAASGFILSVPSEANRKVVENLIEIYSIDFVIVMDNSFLHYALKKIYDSPEVDGSTGRSKSTQESKKDSEKKKVEIIGVSKFDGVIPSDASRIRYCRNIWFFNYFTKEERDLHEKTIRRRSHVISFKYSSCNFVKLDTSSAVPLSALPADSQKIQLDNILVMNYNGSIKDLTHCLLGVSFSNSSKFVHLMNIAAFVYVRKVSEIAIEESEEAPIESEEIEKELGGYYDMNNHEKIKEKEEPSMDNGINNMMKKENTSEEFFELRNKEVRSNELSNENENNFGFREEGEGDEEEMDEDRESQNNKKDYIIEILCPLSITLKNLPPYFIVPGNIKQMKL